MKRLILLALLALPLTAIAYDKEQAELIFKKCALCHSHYGQGIPGGRYPRLSGMEEGYMVQALKDFKEGKRWDTAMSVISGLQDMNEEDMEAVAKYIASINLEEHDPGFDIHHAPGDAKKGEEIFKEDCTDCHGKRGQGKPKKGAPFLRGQYSEYINRQLDQFKKKEREHDRDPEDETFDDYKPEDLNNVIAYVTTLDDKKKAVAQKKPRDIMKEKEAKGDYVFEVAQTVLKMPLQEGLTAEDARQAMLSKAAEVNLKMVGNQIVHEEVRPEV